MAQNKPKIVAIDDSATFISLYRLSAKGLQVDLTAFQSPLDALDHLQKNTVDLIFLDILMGEKDGWSVLRELRAFEHHQNTAVTIVTSKDYDQDRALARKLGAHKYLVKPLRSQEIRDIICQFTGVESVADDEKDL